MGPLIKRRWDKHTYAVHDALTRQFPPGISRENFDFQRWGRAGEIGYGGLQLFDLIVSTVVENDRAAKGDDKRLVGALDPTTGLTASIYLAYGAAANNLRLATVAPSHLNADRYEEAQALLDQFFPLTDDQRARINELAGTIDELADGLESAQVALSHDALCIAAGEPRVQTLSFFDAEDGADEYVIHLALQIAWNHGKRTLMSVVDPDGLRAWAESQ